MCVKMDRLLLMNRGGGGAKHAPAWRNPQCQSRCSRSLPASLGKTSGTCCGGCCLQTTRGTPHLPPAPSRGAAKSPPASCLGSDTAGFQTQSPRPAPAQQESAVSGTRSAGTRTDAWKEAEVKRGKHTRTHLLLGLFNVFFCEGTGAHFPQALHRFRRRQNRERKRGGRTARPDAAAPTDHCLSVCVCDCSHCRTQRQRHTEGDTVRGNTVRGQCTYRRATTVPQSCGQ